MTKPILLLSFLVLITGCKTKSTETPEPATQQSVTLEAVVPKYQAEQNYQWYVGSETRTYTELTLVYIGAYSCGPCRSESFKNDMEDLKVLLRDRAIDQNMEYSVIGIANDLDVQEGLDFLNSAGDYDEVIIGKHWANTGSIDFIWDQEQPEVGIPQVIVYKREVSFYHAGTAVMSFGEKEYLARHMGMHPIQDWIAEGAIFEEI